LLFTNIEKLFIRDLCPVHPEAIDVNPMSGLASGMWFPRTHPKTSTGIQIMPPGACAGAARSLIPGIQFLFAAAAAAAFDPGSHMATGASASACGLDRL